MYFDENNNYFNLEKEENYNFDKYIENAPYTTNINIDNIIFRHNEQLVNPTEGLNRGNLFADSYIPYKNHNYTLKVEGKRDELLYKIQIYTFALIDLNLYLDLHPNETDKLITYKKYNDELKKLKKEYNEKYSPLELCDATSTSNWTWISNPWPWDKGGSK